MPYREDPMMPTCYLKPGEIYFGLEPARVITVLGSCVAVTMYHRPQRIGAICHAMMPTRGNAGKDNIFQYVDTSLDWMFAQFASRRILPRDLEIKLFGGAGMFTSRRGGEQALLVGERNIGMALKVIDAKGLKITAWDVGGDRGRKLTFFTATGETLSHYVEGTLTATSSIKTGRRR